MQPNVSITMSAYNVESFLRDCLDCVVNQTLHEIEIICVNDGSSDGTLSILREYAARDSRIVIIDKAVNEGLAVARNDALTLATGKYIGFVDGDDLLDRDLFRKAYERAEATQCDLLFWDYVTFWEELDLAKLIHEPSQLHFLNPEDKDALLNRPAFAWTKLLRTEKARELAISFPKGLTYQDIPAHWTLVTQIDRIAILPERLSYYRQQPAATTHSNGWKRADLVTVMDLVKEYLVSSGHYPTYRDLFLRKQLESFYGVYDVVDPTLQAQVMRLIQERLGTDQWQYVTDGKALRWQVRDFYQALHGSLFARARRALWLAARQSYRAVK
ncbi:MAG: glycosyltransferase [Spirochaetales bacterium]|nr:glycosyltransferase [Spirochaetales bacterium]